MQRVAGRGTVELGKALDRAAKTRAAAAGAQGCTESAGRAPAHKQAITGRASRRCILLILLGSMHSRALEMTKLDCNNSQARAAQHHQFAGAVGKGVLSKQSALAA